MKYSKQVMIDGYKQSIKRNEEKIDEYSKPCDARKRRIRALERDLLKKKNKELEEKIKELKMKLSELIENYKRIAIFCDKTSTKSVILELQGLEKSQKPVVPQFVADVIEEAREQSVELEDAFEYVWEVATGELREWFRKLENRNNFARAWLDGYEVEEEKRYLVKVKGVNGYGCYLNKGLLSKEYFFESKNEIGGCRTKHTRKELEEAGFGWVFDCPGVEVEEVE